ncbi:hypothetical protein DKY63_04455 [Pseudomonas putida]|uniref:Uncharacterized protein n=1 Tax=Pseudomonas putida TaxID=303 RepID=A0A2Z4REH0_PSEPU|nr:hypothetical protein DKY63_04455 [Pseudomonas putida]
MHAMRIAARNRLASPMGETIARTSEVQATGRDRLRKAALSRQNGVAICVGQKLEKDRLMQSVRAQKYL